MAPLPATPADVHNQGLQDEADDSTFFDDVEAIEPMTDGEEGKWVDDFLGEEEESDLGVRSGSASCTSIARAAGGSKPHEDDPSAGMPVQDEGKTAQPPHESPNAVTNAADDGGGGSLAVAVVDDEDVAHAIEGGEKAHVDTSESTPGVETAAGGTFSGLPQEQEQEDVSASAQEAPKIVALHVQEGIGQGGKKEEAKGEADEEGRKEKEGDEGQEEEEEEEAGPSDTEQDAGGGGGGGGGGWGWGLGLGALGKLKEVAAGGKPVISPM